MIKTHLMFVLKQILNKIVSIFRGFIVTLSEKLLRLFDFCRLRVSCASVLQPLCTYEVVFDFRGPIYMPTGRLSCSKERHTNAHMQHRPSSSSLRARSSARTAIAFNANNFPLYWVQHFLSQGGHFPSCRVSPRSAVVQILCYMDAVGLLGTLSSLVTLLQGDYSTAGDEVCGGYYVANLDTANVDQQNIINFYIETQVTYYI